MDDPFRLFVYGTLMPGEPLWPALAPYAASWGPATARGRIWDTGRGYPAVRFDDEGGPIPGVVVRLHPDRTAEALADLDAIEEEGELYRRLTVDTSAGTAFAYEWLGGTDGFESLPQGWPTR